MPRMSEQSDEDVEREEYLDRKEIEAQRSAEQLRTQVHRARRIWPGRDERLQRSWERALGVDEPAADRRPQNGAWEYIVQTEGQAPGYVGPNADLAWRLYGVLSGGYTVVISRRWVSEVEVLSRSING